MSFMLISNKRFEARRRRLRFASARLAPLATQMPQPTPPVTDLPPPPTLPNPIPPTLDPPLPTLMPSPRPPRVEPPPPPTIPGPVQRLFDFDGPPSAA